MTIEETRGRRRGKGNKKGRRLTYATRFAFDEPFVDGGSIGAPYWAIASVPVAQVFFSLGFIAVCAAILGSLPGGLVVGGGV